MNWLYRKRWKQVLYYGWHSASIVSKESNKNKYSVYFSIITCFAKYYVFANQYETYHLWDLPLEQRIELCQELGEKNTARDNWIVDNYKTRYFIEKWSDKKWNTSPQKTEKRALAYTKRFKTGINLIIQSGVDIHREHFLDGIIKIGNNVFFSKNISLDYSGDVVINDDVKISEGVIIESHSHDGYTNPNSVGSSAKKEELVIDKGAQIGVKAVILESCHKIGRHSRIGAGSIVRFNVPPYAIISGNPAKIIGFSFTPQEMQEFEQNNYPENQRISVEEYEKMYKKYFSSKLKDVKSYIKRSI